MKQTEALEILKGGSNVFLTGSAGSGKTYLLNKFISYLKEQKIHKEFMKDVKQEKFEQRIKKIEQKLNL